MEKCGTCINKGCSSKSRVMVDSSAEESGWTLYFEDLLNNNSDGYFDEESRKSLVVSASTFDDEIGSLELSDAASSASVARISLKTSSKSLSFKKRRCCVVNKISSIAVDDSLEDTASSPVNSPKVSNFDQKDTMNRKLQKEYAEIIQEDGENSSTTTTELKKRGLCLVPVSTIVNYLG